MYREHRCMKSQVNLHMIESERRKTAIGKSLLGLSLLFIVFTANAETTGDVAAGKGLAAKQCAMCHGSEGAGGASAPALKGMAADRLVSQLQAFKSGERKNMMMEMVVKKLSDKDISDLAAYFSSL